MCATHHCQIEGVNCVLAVSPYVDELGLHLVVLAYSERDGDTYLDTTIHYPLGTIPGYKVEVVALPFP